MITDQAVFCRCTALTSRNTGSTRAEAGMIMATNVIKRIVARPLNFTVPRA